MQKKYHQYRIHQDTQMKQSHDQQCESNRCNMQLAVAISWKKTIKSRIYVISDIWRIHEKCAHIKNTQIQKHQQRQQHDQQSWIREANKEKYNSCAG